MRTRSCVPERILPGSRSYYEGVNSPRWHVAVGHGDEDFQPILCGIESDEGINFPSHPTVRVPTCPECLALLAEHGSVAAARRALDGGLHLV